MDKKRIQNKITKNSQFTCPFKSEPIVNKTDRIILLFLIIGVWGLIGTLWLKPNIVGADDVINKHDFVKGKHKHSTNDISKFKWKVRRIVEDCSVTEGEILC